LVKGGIAPKKLLPQYLHISIFNISALLWELCAALVGQWQKKKSQESMHPGAIIM
jgi:hypothetical protein